MINDLPADNEWGVVFLRESKFYVTIGYVLISDWKTNAIL